MSMEKLDIELDQVQISEEEERKRNQQLQNRKMRLEQKIKTAEKQEMRAIKTRRKILLGAFFEKKFRADPALLASLREELLQYVQIKQSDKMQKVNVRVISTLWQKN